ncbi:tetratricopeptide repeat protein [Roseimaritima ulvae]|nr:tetratricopeptide repeat protein [Roseimaritima ulvae]
MNRSEKRQPSVRLSLRKKVLFGLLVTCGFFVFLELSLVLLGLGKNVDTSDPFVGFSKRVPLLERVTDEQGQVQLRTAANKLVWFNDQQFPLKKTANTRRVFCLGGSTTFGRPFADSTSFCGWLREFLPLADDSTQWEVINAGGVSYASYRVAAVMEELAQYEPDLFIVYSGQNEFLERRTYTDMFETSDLNFAVTAALRRTRTWGVLQSAIHRSDDPQRRSPAEVLPGEVDEMLNHTIGPADYHRDAQWHAKVLHHYELNLRRMVAIARGAGAEIAFVVPASNEKNCSPFKSEFEPGIDQPSVNELLKRATVEAHDGQWQRSIATLRQAQRIDDQYALVDYRLGQAYWETGDTEAAQQAFQRALNYDVCPLRAPEAFLETVRKIAAEQDATLIDFEKRLRDRCYDEHGHSLLGEEYFLDHVHPTIDAHRQLALWITEGLRADGIIAGSVIPEAQQQVIVERVRASIDIEQQGVALRNLAKVLHWAGKFDEAAPRARDALQCIPDDPESLVVLADCLVQMHQSEEAVQKYQRLISVAPFYGRGHLAYGEWLLIAGDHENADQHLSMAVALLAPDTDRYWRAVYNGAIAKIKRQQFDEAIPLLEQIDTAFPDDASTLALLAEAKAGLEDTQAAIELYRRAIRLRSGEVAWHTHLGFLLLKIDRPQQALNQFEAALALDAEHPRATSGRSIARQLMNTADESKP